MKTWLWIRDLLSFSLGIGLALYERIDPAPTDEPLLLLAGALLGFPFAARADGSRNGRSRAPGEES